MSYSQLTIFAPLQFIPRNFLQSFIFIKKKHEENQLLNCIVLSDQNSGDAEIQCIARRCIELDEQGKKVRVGVIYSSHRGDALHLIYIHLENNPDHKGSLNSLIIDPTGLYNKDSYIDPLINLLRAVSQNIYVSTDHLQHSKNMCGFFCQYIAECFLSVTENLFEETLRRDALSVKQKNKRDQLVFLEPCSLPLNVLALAQSQTVLELIPNNSRIRVLTDGSELTKQQFSEKYLRCSENSPEKKQNCLLQDYSRLQATEHEINEALYAEAQNYCKADTIEQNYFQEISCDGAPDLK